MIVNRSFRRYGRLAKRSGSKPWRTVTIFETYPAVVRAETATAQAARWIETPAGRRAVQCELYLHGLGDHPDAKGGTA